MEKIHKLTTPNSKIYEPSILNLYGYVLNSPVKYVDPDGLINILLPGLGGSAVGITGGEASGGIVINPGFGEDRADIGVFGSAGIGGGVNVSGDIFVGYVKGGIENVSGTTGNINISAGPIGITIMTDLKTGEVMGGTIGIGPSATIIGASGTVSATGTFTVRDVIKIIGPTYTNTNSDGLYSAPTSAYSK